MHAGGRDDGTTGAMPHHRLRVGLYPIITFEKTATDYHRKPCIKETWHKVVELYCEVSIGYHPTCMARWLQRK
jgi:hypothetical protein